MDAKEKKRIGDFRPQQGLTIMNFMQSLQIFNYESNEGFPSPTGVNYYE